MSDRDRSRCAAVEALVAAVMVVGGLVIIDLRNVLMLFGCGLLVLGILGLAHAVVLGLGLIRLPGVERMGSDDHE
jgi:hypothetical protein